MAAVLSALWSLGGARDGQPARPPPSQQGELDGGRGELMAGKRSKVVLLHGLARRAGCMKSLALHVERNTGMECHCIGYASTSGSLRSLAESTACSIREVVGDDSEVWAVTHSMGGVILRHIQDLPEAGGVNWAGTCMIAPPNRGSVVASILSQSLLVGWVFRFLFGCGGTQLGDLKEAMRWPMPLLPCGVIAGTTSIALSNPTSWMTHVFGLLNGQSDGTVAVEETKLPDSHMSDFAIVPVAHTFIMYDKAVKDHVASFLSTGSFSSAGGAGMRKEGKDHSEADLQDPLLSDSGALINTPDRVRRRPMAEN